MKAAEHDSATDAAEPMEAAARQLNRLPTPELPPSPWGGADTKKGPGWGRKDAGLTDVRSRDGVAARTKAESGVDRPRFCHNILCGMFGLANPGHAVASLHKNNVARGKNMCRCGRKTFKHEPSATDMRWRRSLEPNDEAPMIHMAGWHRAPVLPAPFAGSGYGAGRRVAPLRMARSSTPGVEGQFADGLGWEGENQSGSLWGEVEVSTGRDSATLKPAAAKTEIAAPAEAPDHEHMQVLALLQSTLPRGDREIIVSPRGPEGGILQGPERSADGLRAASEFNSLPASPGSALDSVVEDDQCRHESSGQEKSQCHADSKSSFISKTSPQPKGFEGETLPPNAAEHDFLAIYDDDGSTRSQSMSSSRPRSRDVQREADMRLLKAVVAVENATNSGQGNRRKPLPMSDVRGPGSRREESTNCLWPSMPETKSKPSCSESLLLNRKNQRSASESTASLASLPREMNSGAPVTAVAETKLSAHRWGADAQATRRGKNLLTFVRPLTPSTAALHPESSPQEKGITHVGDFSDSCIADGIQKILNSHDSSRQDYRGEHSNSIEVVRRPRSPAAETLMNAVYRTGESNDAERPGTPLYALASERRKHTAEQDALLCTPMSSVEGRWSPMAELETTKLREGRPGTSTSSKISRPSSRWGTVSPGVRDRPRPATTSGLGASSYTLLEKEMLKQGETYGLLVQRHSGDQGQLLYFGGVAAAHAENYHLSTSFGTGKQGRDIYGRDRKEGLFPRPEKRVAHPMSPNRIEPKGKDGIFSLGEQMQMIIHSGSKHQTCKGNVASTDDQTNTRWRHQPQSKDKRKSKFSAALYLDIERGETVSTVLSPASKTTVPREIHPENSQQGIGKQMHKSELQGKINVTTQKEMIVIFPTRTQTKEPMTPELQHELRRRGLDVDSPFLGRGQGEVLLQHLKFMDHAKINVNGAAIDSLDAGSPGMVPVLAPKLDLEAVSRPSSREITHKKTGLDSIGVVETDTDCAELPSALRSPVEDFLQITHSDRAHDQKETQASRGTDEEPLEQDYNKSPDHKIRMVDSTETSDICLLSGDRARTAPAHISQSGATQNFADTAPPRQQQQWEQEAIEKVVVSGLGERMSIVEDDEMLHVEEPIDGLKATTDFVDGSKSNDKISAQKPGPALASIKLPPEVGPVMAYHGENESHPAHLVGVDGLKHQARKGYETTFASIGLNYNRETRLNGRIDEHQWFRKMNALAEHAQGLLEQAYYGSLYGRKAPTLDSLELASVKKAFFSAANASNFPVMKRTFNAWLGSVNDFKNERVLQGQLYGRHNSSTLYRTLSSRTSPQILKACRQRTGSRAGARSSTPFKADGPSDCLSVSAQMLSRPAQEKELRSKVHGQTGTKPADDRGKAPFSRQRDTINELLAAYKSKQLPLFKGKFTSNLL